MNERRPIPPDSRSVAAVIPCFNAERTVARAIRSVLADSAVTEAIVVDDGSIDDSRSVVAALQPHVRLLEGPNRGACAARNWGLNEATAEFVFFLDADDHIDPGFIAGLRQSADEDVDAVIGAHVQLDGESETVRDVVYRNNLSTAETAAQFIESPVQTGAILWRRSFLLEHGGWDETLPIFQDIELMFRMLLIPARIRTAPDQGHRLRWEAGPAATRISNSMSHKKLQGMLATFRRHGLALSALGDGQARKPLQARLYWLARLSFELGDAEIGRDALDLARDLGLRGHLGSLRHRMMCGLLGLPGKVTISTHLRSKVQKISVSSG